MLRFSGNPDLSHGRHLPRTEIFLFVHNLLKAQLIHNCIAHFLARRGQQHPPAGVQEQKTEKVG